MNLHLKTTDNIAVNPVLKIHIPPRMGHCTLFNLQFLNYIVVFWVISPCRAFQRNDVSILSPEDGAPASRTP